MGWETLLKKYKSNLTPQSVFAAITSPARIIDIFQQTLTCMRDDTHAFAEELKLLRSDSYAYLVAAENEKGEAVPFAYINTYPLTGEGIPVFDLGRGNSRQLYNMRYLANQLTSRVQLTDLPQQGAMIAGPTSRDSVLNNGLEYLHPVYDKWVTVSKLGTNKQGGIMINNSGRIQLGDMNSMQSAKSENTAFAIMPASIYFDSTTIKLDQTDLLAEAIIIADSQGYLSTYNNTLGFLVEKTETGTYSYFTTRVCTQLAERNLLRKQNASEINASEINVALHVNAALQYMRDHQIFGKVALLEEGRVADPIFYYGYEKAMVSSAAPVSFVFGI